MTIKKDISNKARYCFGFALIEFVVIASMIILLAAMIPPYLARRFHTKSAANGDAPLNATIYKEAGILMNPGVAWMATESLTGNQSKSLCTPILKGIGTNSGCVIKVFTTDDISNFNRAAKVFKRNIEADPNTIKGTVISTNFQSSHGVQGVQVCFDYETRSFFKDKKFRTIIYLFQNSKKRCIAINYITNADKDSDRNERMIRDTLALYEK